MELLDFKYATISHSDHFRHADFKIPLPAATPSIGMRVIINFFVAVSELDPLPAYG
jgi:hypothetical protein